jgi:hypothetical protein
MLVILSGCFLAVVYVAYLAVRTFTAQDVCAEDPNVRDSVAVLQREASDLLSATKAVYGDPKSHQWAEVLPRPVAVVSISGKTATLRVTGTIPSSNLRYGIAWRNVYQSYHPQLDVQCVTLVGVSPSERIAQQCCLAPL